MNEKQKIQAQNQEFKRLGKRYNQNPEDIKELFKTLCRGKK